MEEIYAPRHFFISEKKKKLITSFDIIIFPISLMLLRWKSAAQTMS